MDVGCGDLEVMAGADAKHYTGLDISAQAISIARSKRPDWSFITGKITAVEGKTYDLVLCGCVLIHISDRDDYLDHVRRLVDACRDMLIIEAYNNVPTFTSEITFYHEPITETLARDSRIGEIKIIGSYRDIDVVLARRK